MGDRLNKSLLASTAIFNGAGRTLYALCNDKIFYYAGEALSWTCIWLYVFRKVRYPGVCDKIEKELVYGLGVLILGNVLDEYVFDPCAIGVNEYATLALVILRIAYVKYKKIIMSWKDELVQFVSKNIVNIGLILLGLVGKFSYDLLTNKKFTMAYVLGTFGLSVVGGYFTGMWSQMHYPEQANLLTPIGTMLSNNIFSALMVIDYKELLKKNWQGAFEALKRKPD